MNEKTTNSEKNMKKKKTLDKEYSDKDIHNDLRNNFAQEKNLIPSINNLYNPYPKFSDDDIEKKIKDSKNNETINYIEEPCYNTFNEHRSEHKIINRKKNNEENKNKKELEKQRGKNNLEEKVKYLEEMNKIKISGLEQQNTIKINKLSEEYKYNFNIYVKEYQNKNDINMNLFSEKTLLNQKYDSTNQIIAQYSQELESQLEESKTNRER